MNQPLLQEEKTLLLKFLCVLAWADFNVHPAERKFIEELSQKLEIGDRDKIKVKVDSIENGKVSLSPVEDLEIPEEAEGAVSNLQRPAHLVADIPVHHDLRFLHRLLFGLPEAHQGRVRLSS